MTLSHLLQLELVSFQENKCFMTFQVDASNNLLLGPLSQMIRMKTCKSLSTRPPIGQEVSMSGAHSKFIHLFSTGGYKSGTVENDISLAYLRCLMISRSSTYTKRGKMAV